MAKRKNPGKQVIPAPKGPADLPAPNRLLDDVRNLILQGRQAVAQAVNAGLVLLYWQIGQRIRTEVLKEQRADYGEEIISTLSNKLAGEFGTGFSRPNLFRMVRFAEVFPHQEIVSTLSRQLGWSHFVEIIPLKDDLQRDFYAEMCRLERWSVRTATARPSSPLVQILMSKCGMKPPPAASSAVTC
jgi:hypothetical protein